jgi:beta-galactosidase
MYDSKNVMCLDAVNLVAFSLVGDGELIKDQGTSTGSAKVQLYNGRAIIKVKTNAAKNVVAVQSKGIETVFLNL